MSFGYAPCVERRRRPTPPPGHPTAVFYGWPGVGAGRCRFGNRSSAISQTTFQTRRSGRGVARDMEVDEALVGAGHGDPLRGFPVTVRRGEHDVRHEDLRIAIVEREPARLQDRKRVG